MGFFAFVLATGVAKPGSFLNSQPRYIQRKELLAKSYHTHVCLKGRLVRIKIPIKDTKMSDWDILKSEYSLCRATRALVLYHDIRTEKSSFKIQFPMDCPRKVRLITRSGSPSKRIVR